MATHSSILVWKIPWTEEPSGLQSMRSQSTGHDWVTNTLHFFNQRSENKRVNIRKKKGGKDKDSINQSLVRLMKKANKTYYEWEGDTIIHRYEK